MRKAFFGSVILLFIVITLVAYWLKASAPVYDYKVLLGGNIIMAVLSILSYTVVTRQLNNNNPNAFVRGVYASTFLKLFVCIVSILAYALINKPNIHKPSLFALFGIYALYTAIETSILSKTARQTK